jgi:hypothetical protein
VYYGNVLSERAEDEMDLGGIGRVLAMTPNAEVNALVAERYQSTLSSESIYELERVDTGQGLSRRLGGRYLFADPACYSDLEERHDAGARVFTLEIHDPTALHEAIPEIVMPLFVVSSEDRLVIWTQLDPPRLHEGEHLIALIQPDQVEEITGAAPAEVEA